MTAAYIVKTRPTGTGPRPRARYPGETRPPRRWRTRAKFTTYPAAKTAAEHIRGPFGDVGVEVGVWRYGRRLFGLAALALALALAGCTAGPARHTVSPDPDGRGYWTTTGDRSRYTPSRYANPTGPQAGHGHGHHAGHGHGHR